MCGIVYAHNIAGMPVNNAIMQQFDKQRSRGTQGFGVFDGQYKNMIRHSKEDGILKWLVKYNSTHILFHHRYPTSTVNVKRAAHPFSTRDFFNNGDTQYILVHNGSIRNSHSLFGDHLELGINYDSLLEDGSFNDSEALLWDFALTMEGDQPEMKAYGGIAFICMKLVKGEIDKLYFARNRNPLNIKRDKVSLVLSSEGEGDPIDANKLYTYSYKSNKLTVKDMEVREFAKYTPSSNFQRQSQLPYGGNSSYTPGSTAAKNSGFRGTPVPAIPAQTGFEHLDDDERYRTWWNQLEDEDEDIRGGRSGDWLGSFLHRKFDRFFDSKTGELIDPPRVSNSERTIIEYEHDPDTQMMLPVGTKPKKNNITTKVIKHIQEENMTLSDALNLQQQRRNSEELLIARKNVYPTDQEIETEYMAYLASVKGHFEQAYWAIECDYMDAEGKPDTVENMRLRLVLEKVMERISNDPEYDNEESVSSVWEAIWTNSKR